MFACLYNKHIKTLRTTQNITVITRKKMFFFSGIWVTSDFQIYETIKSLPTGYLSFFSQQYETVMKHTFGL